MATTLHPDAPADVSTYRDHLLPLIAGWRKRSARVAIFGTGPHTGDLLDIVPELEDLPIAAYVESSADGSATYRGRPVVPLAAIEDVADVVVCSSYSREAEQLRALDGYRVQVYPSRRPAPAPARDELPAFLHVPTFGYPVIVKPPAGARFTAIDALFARDLDRFRAGLETLAPFFSELADVPDEAVDAITPHWNNGYFYGDDARVAYAMVRAHRPARIVEIGGGNSTKFMHHAIVRNGGGTDIISIDPMPRGPIDDLCAEVIRQPLQRVDPAVFDRLEPGDVLFMDGTHQVFRGTDTVTFFLDVLPRIRPGVLVHVHDITLPADYHDEFADRYYAEQYVLAGMLLGGALCRTTLPVAWLNERGLLTRGGGSFWMERV